MERTIFEGTWEEVASHAAELAGRRVRVVVLADQKAPMLLDQALSGLIREAEQLQRELSPRSNQPTDSSWGEGLVEKFRDQGFRL